MILVGDSLNFVIWRHLLKQMKKENNSLKPKQMNSQISNVYPMKKKKKKKILYLYISSNNFKSTNRKI